MRSVGADTLGTLLRTPSGWQPLPVLLASLPPSCRATREAKGQELEPGVQAAYSKLPDRSKTECTGRCACPQTVQEKWEAGTEQGLSCGQEARSARNVSQEGPPHLLLPGIHRLGHGPGPVRSPPGAEPQGGGLLLKGPEGTGERRWPHGKQPSSKTSSPAPHFPSPCTAVS